MRLVFASNNAHKLEEVRQIMPAGVEVLSLRDIGFTAEIEETGATLEENSRIKAEAIGIDGVFADDTGLEIDALDGKPGVYTARWSGASGPEQKIFLSNRAKALHELAGVENRGAQFRTVITLILNGKTIQVEGVVRGTIATEERGEGGFGHDPIFVPEGYDKTFAELPAEVKNSISHRGRALAKLVEILKQ
ncbi:MAG: RdgB/HAM1 family non-canonical purine NTP pyrophosphatase [Paludibacteraceae bacterium]|nr:RdgB/HAM1 family non-canonical purine NTP pyrophosphatase [Paludibacteraceae bacterium]